MRFVLGAHTSASEGVLHVPREFEVGGEKLTGFLRTTEAIFRFFLVFLVIFFSVCVAVWSNLLLSYRESRSQK